jgi:hypothetical protein
MTIRPRIKVATGKGLVAAQVAYAEAYNSLSPISEVGRRDVMVRIRVEADQRPTSL